MLMTIAAAGAYMAATGHHEQTPERIGQATAAVEQHTTMSHSAASVRDRDDVATQDITLHAFRHLDDPNPLQSSGGACAGWTPNWELRWQDFETPHGHARIYHATSHHHPGVRFTVTADPHDLSTHAWERAQ
jgi:hypothetical protein